MLKQLLVTLLCCLLLPRLTAQAQSQAQLLQAEGAQAELVQATLGTRNNVTYAENLTQVGSAVTFSVSVAAAGAYTLTSRYAAAREYAETMSVYVNNRDVTQAQFASTASWDSWSAQQVTVYLLGAPHLNKVSYRYDADDSGWINLDYIRISPAITPDYTAGSAAAADLPSEIGVDKFTGTVTVTVPLYTVSVPGVEVPLALQYTGSGVQVSDAGDGVGVNWSLQAGLSIRRQVRDLPDDQLRPTGPEPRYGWLHYASPTDKVNAVPEAGTAFFSGCSSEEQLALASLTSFGSLNHQDGGNASQAFSLYDTEPDVYTYAVPGYAGKFVFDGTHQVRLFPYQPVQIVPQVASAPTSVPVGDNCSASLATGELLGFTLTTPAGVVYTFDCLERIQQKAHAGLPTSPVSYFARQSWSLISERIIYPYSYDYPGTREVSTGWLVTKITTPAARQQSPAVSYQNLATGQAVPLNTISFRYSCTAPAYVSYTLSKNGLSLGSGNTYPGGDGQPATRLLTSPQLTSIESPTATVALGWALGGEEARLNSLTITSPLAGEALLKAYAFRYCSARANLTTGYQWYKGVTPYDPARNYSNRSFLLGIDLQRASASLPLYAFAYSQLQLDGRNTASSPLPPTDATNRDYWGYVTPNGPTWMLPRVYIHPQLLDLSSPPPGAPYRLFPDARHPSGATMLAGADRRPTPDLRLALAGALTEMTFATGGRVAFDYEQHRFYDPVAQQSQPAGGLRLRAIRQLDPVTRVETRRDYTYQLPSGQASGVLLHWPHLAFSWPTGTATSWVNLTTRSLEDLAPDPFESRAIGYSQVTEQVPGKGQVTTTFAVPAAADDVVSPPDATSGLPAWQRPGTGLARQFANGACPSVAPLTRSVSELYPFAPAPNYDFCRGVPLRVRYQAEPASPAAEGDLVREETYAYQYQNVAPATAPAVTGLRYEQFGPGTAPLYAYGKYRLLTDFLYTVSRQVVRMPGANGLATQTSTDYRYTTRGQLATKLVLGSDNSLTRTRYKYLADYAPYFDQADGPELQAMRQRVREEQVSEDVVETITEFRPAGSGGRPAYVGAALQTFATNPLPSSGPPLTTPTYPARLRRWQPAQPVVSYDSVRVIASGGYNSLYVPTGLRPASTILAADGNLTPLSVSTPAGRQTVSKHVAYAGSLSVAQIVHATAAEVVFSDFEFDRENRPFTFQKFSNNSNGYMPYADPIAARTGAAGLVVRGGEGVKCTLPASPAAQYHLVLWARADAAATLTVRLASAQATVFTQAFTPGAQWQRYEVLLPANLSSATTYQLTLGADATVQVDDVLLAPNTAVVTSTTYDPALGKTSETSDRGRTTYYEYGPTGDLALVRDHNRAIVQQYEKVLPNRILYSGLSFTTSGTLVENTLVTFTAVTNLAGPLKCKWVFGDGPNAPTINYPPSSTTSTAPVTNQTVSYSFPSLGYNKKYSVRLYVTSQGKEYTCVQDVDISLQRMSLTSCVVGVVKIDGCNKRADVVADGTCTSTPAGRNTTFRVTPDLAGALTYTWERIVPGDPTGRWEAILGKTAVVSTSPVELTVSASPLLHYRCRVSNPYQEQESEELFVEHYSSCP